MASLRFVVGTLRACEGMARWMIIWCENFSIRKRTYVQMSFVCRVTTAVNPFGSVCDFIKLSRQRCKHMRRARSTRIDSKRSWAVNAIRMRHQLNCEWNVFLRHIIIFNGISCRYPFLRRVHTPPQFGVFVDSGRNSRPFIFMLVFYLCLRIMRNESKHPVAVSSPFAGVHA